MFQTIKYNGVSKLLTALLVPYLSTQPEVEKIPKIYPKMQTASDSEIRDYNSGVQTRQVKRKSYQQFIKDKVLTLRSVARRDKYKKVKVIL